MKNLTALAVICGLALAGAPALAQQATDPHHPGGQPPAAAKPAQPGPAMGGMMGGQGMTGGGMHGMQMGPGKHVEGRLAFLRAEIGITEAQAASWNAFADAVRKSGKSMMASMPMMQPKDAKADWVANLERHEKMATSHLEGLRAIRKAAEPLYAQFSDEQKRIANDLMAGPMGPMGGMSPMMRM